MTPGIAKAPRFEFGKNWSRFLQVVDERRVCEAERSLRGLLQVDDLRGRRFLDAGSGSGLFSLAACRLGASVHSFDFDPRSVTCTCELRSRHVTPGAEWSVEQGSVLDREYLAGLGRYDVVYAWGVLHHTGAMWQALENLLPLVSSNGHLCIAIYNDQGLRSRIWRSVKRTYNRLPAPLQAPYTALAMAPFWLRSLLWDVIRLRPQLFAQRWAGYERHRGMNYWRDCVDWVGGYPFEVAEPGRVHEYCVGRGFELVRSTVSAGWGCNEFVFRKRQEQLREAR
jgi:2-polyprenyl-6-hydroxyphenyl methylase/3-demethylubiquinone-9 3-methyltransferase